MHVLDRVRRTIRRHDLARPGTRVVVALSGGSDSVALLNVLRRLEAAREQSVAGVAHFNHQLRAAASADEAFCRDLAAAVGKEFVVDREAVTERARRERRSLEDAARTARHAFLERARRQLGADVVALGHTKDDQAETFLLRLLRGAGTRGLAGMHPRRGALIRPLIECTRVELREFLESIGGAYVEDETNDDVRIPRNRVRAELLPFLARFNPSIVDVLAGEAEMARAAWQWMEPEAARLADKVCAQQSDDVWRVDADALARAPLALARMVLHQAMTRAAGGRLMSFQHVDRALELAFAGGGPIDAPGHRLERDGAAIVLTMKPTDVVGRWTSSGRRQSNFSEYPLSIPGEVVLRESKCLVTAEFGSAPDGDSRDAVLGTGAVALVRRDRCSDTLSVRYRRPGDRFQPPGLGGRHKKLQDFFVDRKVARHRRDVVPLVVDAAGRIVWVAGYALNEEFRVTTPAEAVVILRLKVLGGLA